MIITHSTQRYFPRMLNWKKETICLKILDENRKLLMNDMRNV